MFQVYELEPSEQGGEYIPLVMRSAGYSHYGHKQLSTVSYCFKVPSRHKLPDIPNVPSDTDNKKRYDTIWGMKKLRPKLNAEDKALMEKLLLAGHIEHKYVVRLQTVLLRKKGKGTAYNPQSSRTAKLRLYPSWDNHIVCSAGLFNRECHWRMYWKASFRGLYTFF